MPQETAALRRDTRVRMFRRRDEVVHLYAFAGLGLLNSAHISGVNWKSACV